MSLNQFCRPCGGLTDCGIQRTVVLLSREDGLHSKEQARPQNGSKVLRICDLITEDIDPTLKLAIMLGWGEEEGRALEDDVLMGLLPDHPAELVLVGEDDRQGCRLGLLDEFGSAAGQLYVVGVGEVEGLEVAALGVEGALDGVDAVEVFEIDGLAGGGGPSAPPQQIINRHNY
jgi:hypothetical protein